MAPDTRRGLKRRRVPATRGRVTLASVIAAVLVATGLQTKFGTSFLEHLGLASPPRPLVELYFAEPGAHPEQVQPPGQQVPVAFVIRNRGAPSEGLTWRIETDNGGGAKQAAAGTVSLAEGESRSIREVVAVPCAGVSAQSARTQVRVSIDQPPRAILFWVACASARP